jgi:hypothetical protein
VSHNFLILTHKSIDHIYTYAAKYLNYNFYIHVDKKIDINLIKKGVRPNIHFVNNANRVDIKWAGFSMIQATLNLINFALLHDQNNQFFHLISGDDVLLSKTFEWTDSNIYMECRYSMEHSYRMRFNTPHADTKYQRSFLGKVLTQIYKKLDKIFPTKEKFYFGSQWFSIRRNELDILMKSVTIHDVKYFKKKLCPDEHFFQYLVVKNNMLDKISNHGNKRFIVFDPEFQRGSSPIFLSIEQLINAQKHNYWFARKVESRQMKYFYQYSNEE